MGPRLLVGVFFVLACVATAQAVTIRQPSLLEPPAIDSLRLTDPATIRDGQLREIVELMGTGKQQEANLKIANLLARRPKDKEALELAGISLMIMKNFAAAEEAFRRLVALPPVNADVISKYGVTKILNGDIEMGAKLLQQVVQHQPENRLANRYLGWVAQKTGNPRQAAYYLSRLPSPEAAGIQDYHLALADSLERLGAYQAIVELFAEAVPPSALERSTSHSHAALYLAVAHAALGEHDKAAALVQVLRQQAADDPLNLFRLNINLARVTKDVEAGQQSVTSLLRRLPDAEVMARFELARVYLAADDLVGALEQYETTLSLADEQEVVEVLQTMVPVMLDASLHNQAIEVVQQVSRRYPENETLRYSLAELQALTSRGQGALHTLAPLIERPEPHLQGLLLAGNIARSDKDYGVALRHLRQLVELQPDNTDGWVTLAGVYFDQQQSDEAIAVLENAVQANPNQAVLRYELGTLYQAIGDLPAANMQYEAALGLDQNYLAAMDNLASNLLDSNQDVAKAKALAQRAYERQPNDPYIQDLWGWALYRNGELDQAETLLRKAAQELTDSGRADYHLALTLRDLGEAAQAQQHFKLAMEKGLPDAAQQEARAALQVVD